MHGMLFHPDVNDIQEDLTYARWLGAGVVRVFATDSSGDYNWGGTQVGMNRSLRYSADGGNGGGFR